MKIVKTKKLVEIMGEDLGANSFLGFSLIYGRVEEDYNQRFSEDNSCGGDYFELCRRTALNNPQDLKYHDLVRVSGIRVVSLE